MCSEHRSPSNLVPCERAAESHSLLTEPIENSNRATALLVKSMKQVLEAIVVEAILASGSRAVLWTRPYANDHTR